jgi:photosynthetic reaction center cytochrome c subunit
VLHLLAALSIGLWLTACERFPVQSTQQGYRGTGMVQIDNPRILAAAAAARPALPASTPQAGSDGPKAKDVFQNVKLLGDLSVGEFTRTMVAMTAWVAPVEGCNYCHAGCQPGRRQQVPEGRGPPHDRDDAPHQRRLERARRQDRRHLLHLPPRAEPAGPDLAHRRAVQAQRAGSLLGNDFGQNKGVPSIAWHIDAPRPVHRPARRQGSHPRHRPEALPSGYKASLQSTEKTYSLMNHISLALGVNCTFCHNTRSFPSWDGPTQRVTAWHGIQMARDLNVDYMKPLTGSFPKARLGPTGDVAKVFCATCHQGQNKPLGGVAMAPDYPALMAAAAAPAAAALPAPVAEALRSVLYFGVGSPTLEGAQAKGLAQLIDSMSKQGKTVASISGYHSAAGTLSANQELAKQRAFSVRDALLAAGIAESRVKLQKPVQAEANLAGEDPAARRVEVTVK